MGFCENEKCPKYLEGYCKENLVPVIQDKDFYRCLPLKDVGKHLTIREFEMICCGEKLKFEIYQNGISYCPEVAKCVRCGREYEKKPKSPITYMWLKENDQNFCVCTHCGSVIQAESVAHPIWDWTSSRIK